MGLVAGGTGLIVFGIIILMASFFISGFTQDNVSQCGEWYGQLGQMLDSQTSESCQNVSMMQSASQAGIPIGIIIAVIGIVCLGVGLARPKSKTESQLEVGKKHETEVTSPIRSIDGSDGKPEVGKKHETEVRSPIRSIDGSDGKPEVGKKHETEVRSPIRSIDGSDGKPEVGSIDGSDGKLDDVQKYGIPIVIIVVGAFAVFAVVVLVPSFDGIGTIQTQEEQHIDYCDSWVMELDNKRVELDSRQESLDGISDLSDELNSDIDQYNLDLDRYNLECVGEVTNYYEENK